MVRLYGVKLWDILKGCKDDERLIIHAVKGYTIEITPKSERWICLQRLLNTSVVRTRLTDSGEKEIWLRGTCDETC